MSIFARSAACSFFYENSTSAKDKRKISVVTEAEMNNVSTNLVTDLYKSAINKSYIDFGDIPNSKGDITKYSGFASMMSILKTMEDIAAKSSIKINELDIINKTISNIISLKETFTKGFTYNKDFLQLQYNCIVASCIEGTSVLIASYVDYLRSADVFEFVVNKYNDMASSMVFDNLEKFNKSIANGDFSKAANFVLKNGEKRVLTESAIVVTAIILSAILAVVVGLRQIVFSMYYRRMKMSDYLKMQATFLEMNRANLEAQGSNMSPAKRKEVIAKQKKLAAKLNNMSEKLKVANSIDDSKAISDLKKENSTYTLDEMKTNRNIDSVELL